MGVGPRSLSLITASIYAQGLPFLFAGAHRYLLWVSQGTATILQKTDAVDFSRQYTSHWSGQLDCAAIWSHLAIKTSKQTPLMKYEKGRQDIYEIFCDDLGFYFTQD